MKVSLVLGGGAARGAFHLGVLEAMDELGIKIQAISGVSIGAIIACSYASGLKPKEILEVFKSKEIKKAYSLNFFNKSFLKIDNEHPTVDKLLPIQNLEELHVKTYVTTLDLLSGEIVRFDKGCVKSLCKASSALIPVFSKVPYSKYELIDGGIVDNLPIEPLKKYDFPIFAVDLHPDSFGFTNSFLGIIKRALFLMWRASVQKQKIEADLYITDDRLSMFSLFSYKNLDAMFDFGYKMAKRKILEFEKASSYNQNNSTIDKK